MKTAALREVKAKLSEYCQRSQGERVLITRHGKPLAVMIGVEGRELEDVLLASTPEFWQLVERRRQESTLSGAEVRRQLEERGGTGARRAPRRFGAKTRSRTAAARPKRAVKR